MHQVGRDLRFTEEIGCFRIEEYTGKNHRYVVRLVVNNLDDESYLIKTFKAEDYHDIDRAFKDARSFAMRAMYRAKIKVEAEARKSPSARGEWF